MSLSVKNLNGDTTFLLTFTPAIAPARSQAVFPGSFTILVDPWLVGSSSVWNERFQISHHTAQPIASSLADLPQPDLILISQAKPDHCHRQTLCSLPNDTHIPILAVPDAAKDIRSWQHFTGDNLTTIKPYKTAKEATIIRIPLSAYAMNTTPGEVTLAFIPEKRDMTGLHNAIGITYRPPGTTFQLNADQAINLPLLDSPPSTPPRSRDGSNSAQADSLFSTTTLSKPSSYQPSLPDSPMSGQMHPIIPQRPPLNSTDRTISVLYTPHGTSSASLTPYINNHLARLSALPLTALFHCINLERNPLLLGGRVARGFPSGAKLVRQMGARYWISSHDEVKDNRGWSTAWLKSRRWTVGEAQDGVDEEDLRREMEMEDDRDGGRSKAGRTKTIVVELGIGDEMRT